MHNYEPAFVIASICSLYVVNFNTSGLTFNFSKLMTWQGLLFVYGFFSFETNLLNEYLNTGSFLEVFTKF